jgi:hypothetical protein
MLHAGKKLCFAPQQSTFSGSMQNKIAQPFDARRGAAIVLGL